MAHFRKIFWGLPLICLTLHNIHCAALGYFLLALGAAGLTPVSPRFRRAAVLSWVGAIWSLASIWLLDLVVLGGPMFGVESTLYWCVRALIDCPLVWSLAGGIAEYANARGRPDLARRAAQLRIAYLALTMAMIVWFFSGGEAGFQPNALGVPFRAPVFFLPWLVWLVMALRLVTFVRRQVAAKDAPAADDAGRRWQFSLRTLLLMPLVLWLLLLACFPKLMTGDFCKVRIEELSVDGGGQVRTTFLIRISSGTHTRGYGNSFAWSGFPPGRLPGVSCPGSVGPICTKVPCPPKNFTGTFWSRKDGPTAWCRESRSTFMISRARTASGIPATSKWCPAAAWDSEIQRIISSPTERGHGPRGLPLSPGPATITTMPPEGAPHVIPTRGEQPCRT